MFCVYWSSALGREWYSKMELYVLTSPKERLQQKQQQQQLRIQKKKTIIKIKEEEKSKKHTWTESKKTVHYAYKCTNPPNIAMLHRKKIENEQQKKKKKSKRDVDKRLQ